MQARIEELEAGAGAATAEAVRLRAQLDEKEQQIAAVAGIEANADRQMSEWRDRVDQAEQASGSRATRRGCRAQVADIKGCSRPAEQPRRRQQLTALEHERDGGLRSQLGDVTARLRRSKRPTGSLHTSSARCAKLRRRPPIGPPNLVAVEDRVRQLNGTLEVIEPAGGRLEPIPRAPLCQRAIFAGGMDNGILRQR